MREYILRLVVIACWAFGFSGMAGETPRELKWPEESHLTKPWTFWHWMGDAGVRLEQAVHSQRLEGLTLAVFFPVFKPL